MKSSLQRRIKIWVHPYKRSPKSHVYEEIAEICGCSPDRVYRIAHGARLSDREASSVIPELISRGIIQ